MPITEGPLIDTRTAFVRELFTLIKDNPEAQQPYRERHEQQVAETTAREARRERMRAIARLKRPKKPGSRPWQKEGFATKQAWLDATSPLRVTGEVEPRREADDLVLAPTKREQIEAKLKR